MTAVGSRTGAERQVERATHVAPPRGRGAWADWSAFAVGVLLSASPLLMPGSPDSSGTGNALVCGLAIMGLALTARAAKQDRWHWHGLIVAFGVWLVVMPLMWGYVRAPFKVTSVVVGLVVIALMVWPLWQAVRSTRSAGAGAVSARRTQGHPTVHR